MSIHDHYSTFPEKISLEDLVNENDKRNSQITLQRQETLPEIYSVKQMHVIITMGRIVIRLNDQEETIYTAGNVIDVPGRTKMKIKNMSSYKTAMLIMDS